VDIAASSARFPSTSWSCIRQVQDQDPGHPQFVAAVNRLVGAYWRPAFHYLRARGYRAAEAEDLTQEFFCCCLVKASWLQLADQRRGQFRNFLRTLLKRFAYDRTARALAQEKFDNQFVAIADYMQDSDRSYEPPAHETPDEAFDRQWRAELLATVRKNLRTYYEGNGVARVRRQYEIFAAYHFVDRADDQPTQEALAARFGVSRDVVRSALDCVRKRYERFLRLEVRDQVSSEEDVDEEIRRLLSPPDNNC
jgi:DNA-directed RNA polymerase specialized sigma24 family protein